MRTALWLAGVVLAVMVAMSVAVGCGPPKMPVGPAPEYEDPPRPSWLNAPDAEAPEAGVLPTS